MPMFRVVTPLRNGGPRPVAPGKVVELDEADGVDLVAIGAVEPAGDDERPDPEPAPKPLARMTKAELAAVVAAERVEVAADATNAQIVAAIEAKRTEAGG